MANAAGSSAVVVASTADLRPPQWVRIHSLFDLLGVHSFFAVSCDFGLRRPPRHAGGNGGTGAQQARGQTGGQRQDFFSMARPFEFSANSSGGGKHLHALRTGRCKVSGQVLVYGDRAEADAAQPCASVFQSRLVVAATTAQNSGVGWLISPLREHWSW